MIIWLASYPKSGNTWMRTMISSLLYTDDGVFDFSLIKKIDQFPEKKFLKSFVKDFSNFDDIKKNWIVAQDQINLDKQIKLFKTHQGNFTVGKDSFTNRENTLAIIYIVRDPRNLVRSIANHYTYSINQSCEFLLSPQIIGNKKSFEEKQGGLYNLLGKWNDHYISWTRNKTNLLLIKYEDLIKNPKLELKKTINFLQKYLTFKSDEDKINKIIETTSFDNLKNMEKEGLFTENVLNKQNESKVNFFHLGPANNWKDNLNENIKNKIEKNFYKEMVELEYL